jgi:hypothetical protein
LNFFGGQEVSGTATGGGTATAVGSAQDMIAPPYAISDSTASGAFTSISGSSGRVDTIYGSAEGSAAGGATGSQAGTVLITAGGLGTLKFDGTTTASGTGSFGAGFSPIQFNTVTTEIPGVAIVTLGSPKTGGNAISAPTFVTTVVPVSTGPTSGFGSGAGALSVVSTTTGTLRGESGGPMFNEGTGSSGGAATNFGGGMGSGTNLFGTASGLGSGASTGVAAAAGSTKFDPVNGVFTAAGGATGNFNNQASGVFGTAATPYFPSFP